MKNSQQSNSIPSDKVELAKSLSMINRSMEDIRMGRTQLAKQAIVEIADKLGLKLVEHSSSQSLSSQSTTQGSPGDTV